MKRLYILTLCSIIAAALIFSFKKRVPSTIPNGKGLIVPRNWLQPNNTVRTPKADVRPADQTFLTFPEWFLVFSPDEQAAYFKSHTATTFPFMAHTAQIWESYSVVSNQIRDIFPKNRGYHFMIKVIGSSATAEYSVKAWYETLIGRLTDTHRPVTEEDRFNADFTQSYVDFIRDSPWYEYNFKHQIAALWADVPFAGTNIFRKLERRYILTSELLVKYAYGKLIGLGTKQIYDEALPTTAVIVDNDSLRYLPRYDKFIAGAETIVHQGHAFKEIAGNTSAILVTVLIPVQTKLTLPNAVVLFEQPVASNSATKRVAIVTPVAHLHELLRQIQHENVRLEHIFDY